MYKTVHNAKLHVFLPAIIYIFSLCTPVVLKDTDFDS